MLAEGLMGPKVGPAARAPTIHESSDELKALQLAEGSFSDSPQSRSRFGSLKALQLAQNTFNPAMNGDSRDQTVTSPNEKLAIRLAEGDISNSEENGMVHDYEDLGKTGHPRNVDLEAAKEFASASERRALRLAEGRLTRKQALAIASGGEGDWEGDASSDLQEGREDGEDSDEKDDFQLPSDSDTEHAIVFGREDERRKAVSGLLKAAEKLTGNTKLSKRVKAPAAEHISHAERVHRKLSALSRRAVPHHAAWAKGRGQKALGALNMLATDAQSSLDDLSVPAGKAVRRGWGGL